MTVNEADSPPVAPTADSVTHASGYTEPGVCVRGTSCEDRRTVQDLAGGTTTSGAPSHQALCPTCVRYLGYTLTALPLDVAELGLHFAPTMQITYRDPDVPTQPRIKLHAPLPINGNAEALQALIDHETTSWADSVAAAAGVAWSTYWADHSRQGSRVQKACQLLQFRLPWLLGLPAVRHRARSAGEHPLDGWDPALVALMEHDGRDYWVWRNGTDAALTLFELHAQVERLVGRAASDRCRIPCPHCERRALVREHRRGEVTCRACWHTLSDDDYEQLVDVTSALFGVA